MERYKNINSINEVNKVLKNLQELYTKKDKSEIEDFVKKGFYLQDGFATLGSGINQWCSNSNDIKELIKFHFSNENNYWREIDFKFEQAKIFANENVAWVVSIGNIRNILSEDEQIEETINKVKDILKGEERSKENALDAARKIARTLREIDRGENYVWPFRFTCVLIKENDTWKFHQMQFSLDSESFSYRFTDDNYDKSVFEMPKANSNGEIEEVRKVLQVFQDGYTKRDLNYVDEYMKKVFLLQEDLVVIGTDAEELCLGIDSTRGIIASDWKYWGDFKMNVEDAIICVNGEVAYFTTKAILTRIISNKEILEWISGSAKDSFESEGIPKHKLMEALWDMLDLLYENQKGEKFITPMRFSGVLVKEDGRWLIQHAQYSDYTDGMPGVRI
ncbi:nuclear transport factor 2 family protein [Clostridium tagluense]|uniref:nuclear transport factor 2 family protein n=1 Tax=Clostridium tagluense TaxID=360422 RepID=UPI001CF1B840|nr:nuclear transport factor 2 family protein [Clostridium tagluense]MCB2309771.1 nuclear transport factor 2 family protein [Clostridium tagluense]MCB2314699.1 nuclear transport factor 2 family protein [Clostridium tagluense]MCB2319548.1 nuclear transport factor 2 family protein [Clostridium tagluense]MCB2324365.1 nuclear transport factor 2 family protein [Clostridium tagluense]MCB2329216.1 nuclear transport factor 2 family protein [Clostridium tagluense]